MPGTPGGTIKNFPTNFFDSRKKLKLKKLNYLTIFQEPEPFNGNNNGKKDVTNNSAAKPLPSTPVVTSTSPLFDMSNVMNPFNTSNGNLPISNPFSNQTPLTPTSSKFTKKSKKNRENSWKSFIREI